MPGVLTKGSNVICGHGGTVATASSAKLKVSGQSVLLKDGIADKPVSACATPPAVDGSGTTIAQPCTKVSSVLSGEAVKLKVGGKAVMLETLSGQTDGMVAKVTPQLLLSATAAQSKLTGI